VSTIPGNPNNLYSVDLVGFEANGIDVDILTEFGSVPGTIEKASVSP